MRLSRRIFPPWPQKVCKFRLGFRCFLCRMDGVHEKLVREKAIKFDLLGPSSFN